MAQSRIVVVPPGRSVPPPNVVPPVVAPPAADAAPPVPPAVPPAKAQPVPPVAPPVPPAPSVDLPTLQAALLSLQSQQAPPAQGHQPGPQGAQALGQAAQLAPVPAPQPAHQPPGQFDHQPSHQLAQLVLFSLLPRRRLNRITEGMHKIPGMLTPRDSVPRRSLQHTPYQLIPSTSPTNPGPPNLLHKTTISLPPPALAITPLASPGSVFLWECPLRI
eukprot:gene13203-3860_t